MDGIVQFMKNLGTIRLVIFGTIFFLVITVLISITGQISSGPMTILFTGLDNESQNRISQTLSARNIDYEISGGDSILVPQSMATELRMQLAQDGLSGTIPGYKELFPTEDGPFGQTSTVIDLNIKRALEGELAKTFKVMKGVASARVLIAMPKKRAFGQSQEPSAAVTISPSSGGISRSQAQAIQTLAAAAVPGLSPDRVTVADTSGRLLTDGTSSQSMGGLSNLEETRLAKEGLFQDRIETQLERVVGLGRVQANVTIDMTTDRITEQQTVFDADNQVVSSQQINEESSGSTQQQGGPASVSTQTPGANAGGAGGGSDNSSKTTETTKFDNSKTIRNVIKEPGAITKISVAVLVDYNRPLDANRRLLDPVPHSAAQMQALTELVKASIPFVDGRDPDPVVTQMIFAEEPEIEERVQEWEWMGFSKEDIMPIAKMLVWTLMGLILIVMVIRPIAMRLVEAIPDKVAQPDPDQIENKAATSTPILITADGTPISKEVIEAAAQGDEEASRAVLDARQTGSMVEENMAIETKINVAQVEGRIQESAMKKVSEIIVSNPEESAAIIRSWLYED